MYEIKLPIEFYGERYGLTFENGIAMTDDERIMEMMKQKGFEVGGGQPYQPKPPRYTKKAEPNAEEETN